MIPTKEQWKAFSLLEKWGIVSAIATILALLFAVFVYIHPPVIPVSIQEQIAKDDNHTKLTIDNVTIKNWLGDSEPYITIAIRNSSKRTALNVKPAFVGQNEIWRFTPTKTSSLFQQGLAIDAGATLEYPIAPVSEFTRKIKSECPGCYLAELGVTPNIPPELKERLCKNLLDSTNRCALSMKSIPTPIKIYYKTIFDDENEQFFAIYSYISENIPTLFSIP